MRFPAPIRLLRPEQWLKNAFLFAALIFSRHLFERAFLVQALLGFVVFSFTSSIVYIVNDIADREADRRHPTKRNRPIASGAVSVWQALSAAVVLAAVVLALLPRFELAFGLSVLIYLLMNLGYSFGLKRVMLVDIFVIAAGFMIRVLAGAFAIAVSISPWLVLCTLFISIFLASSKRRAEILLTQRANNSASRAVLKEYTPEFIDQIMTVAASGMGIAYALYTVAERTVTMFGTENLIFTTVFVLFGIFRYLHLVRVQGTDDNPTRMVLRDTPLLCNVLAWFATCVVIIYFQDIQAWLR